MTSPTSLPRLQLPDAPRREITLTERIGFEIELVAPRGASRADLAHELARRHGGTVRRMFHTDSEPSLVPGMSHFIHLTPGFDVVAADGGQLCRLVDDITLRQDLDPHAAPRPGWYRIIGDEPRLMRLVHRHADPYAPLEEVLGPLADLFGVAAEHVEGIVRVDDGEGSTITMAAPLPGECERPCEVITPPIDRDHRARLHTLLAAARDLGFTVPAEAAVHLHVDAAPLREVATFANLVRLFSDWREPLRAALGTNPLCRRLAPLPPAAVQFVADGLPADWERLCAGVAGLGLTKYADVNLTRLVAPRPVGDTVEIRCLPGSIDPDRIVEQALLVEQLLERCRDPRPLPPPVPGDAVEMLVSP